MKTETVVYKCGGCGLTKRETRSGVVELKTYFCIDCGLMLTELFDETYPTVHRIMEGQSHSS